jgi:hypothetical protein
MSGGGGKADGVASSKDSNTVDFMEEGSKEKVGKANVKLTKAVEVGI